MTPSLATGKQRHELAAIQACTSSEQRCITSSLCGITNQERAALPPRLRAQIGGGREPIWQAIRRVFLPEQHMSPSDNPLQPSLLVAGPAWVACNDLPLWVELGRLLGSVSDGMRGHRAAKYNRSCRCCPARGHPHQPWVSAKASAHPPAHGWAPGHDFPIALTVVAHCGSHCGSGPPGCRALVSQPVSQSVSQPAGKPVVGLQRQLQARRPRGLPTSRHFLQHDPFVVAVGALPIRRGFQEIRDSIHRWNDCERMAGSIAAQALPVAE
jgi:hypothetical protein